MGVIHPDPLRHTTEAHLKEKAKMEKDVVCGMQVDPANAAGSSQYNGTTYYSAQRVAKRSSTRIPHNSQSRDNSACGVS
jgi:YHS domain-containing protein